MRNEVDRMVGVDNVQSAVGVVNRNDASKGSDKVGDLTTLSISHSNMNAGVFSTPSYAHTPNISGNESPFPAPGARAHAEVVQQSLDDYSERLVRLFEQKLRASTTFK